MSLNNDPSDQVDGLYCTLYNDNASDINKKIIQLDLTQDEPNQLLSQNTCKSIDNCAGFMYDKTKYYSWLENGFAPNPANANTDIFNTGAINSLNNNNYPRFNMPKYF